MKSKLHEYLNFWAAVNILPRTEAAGKGFKVSFQYDGSWSSDEWVEYRGNIPKLKEFTVCHWERLHYISTSDTQAWSYCIILSEHNAPFKCIGVYSTGVRSSANSGPMSGKRLLSFISI